ncbi:uncharacterized protein [Pyrus communis]|uniref:uncharacterized protein n=1 Tax=Pyrus communis TaxID=23211 RepID=UPI0035BFE93E
MNLDGSWNAKRKVVGFGAVIRGSDGVFVAAHYGSFEHVFSPIQLEAMAVQAGLLWAVDRGFSFLLVETDTLQILEALMDSCLNLSIIGQIVEDCKELLAIITEATISHTCHQVNVAAHRLNKNGLALGHCSECLDSPPSIIIDLLVEESHSSL